MKGSRIKTASSYKLENVTAETLKAFISLRNPKADAAYQKALTKVAEGNYDFGRRWLFTKDKTALAKLTRFRTPRPIYSLVTPPDISEQDSTALLELAKQLSEEDNPVTLNYTTGNYLTARAKDISGVALHQGWTVETHVLGFDTPLAERKDLQADVAARSFPLKHLQSTDFANFYKPIWSADASVQKLKPFEDEIAAFFENNTVGEVVYLYQAAEPVAVGVVDYEDIGTMTVIGVLPEFRRQGWGTRLHRHLMWAIQQHVELYRG